MKLKSFLVFLLFVFAMGYLAVQAHIGFERGQNWRVTYRSDKAGYSVYLPSTFKYNWDASKFPDSSEYVVGNGFKLDRSTNIVHTKYAYGTALLQAPFYLFGEAYSSFVGDHSPSDPLPSIHTLRALHFSGAFYVALGLIILFPVVKRRLKLYDTLLLLAGILLATPLLYYSWFDATMSHGYSFFAVCLLLWSLDQLIVKPSWKYWFWCTLSLCLLTIIRHVDAFLIIPVLLLISSNENTSKWIRQRRFIPIWVSLTLGAIFIFPQLLYYYYESGMWWKYAYEVDSGGFNWDNPRLFLQYFGPRNGLFIYTPLLGIGIIYFLVWCFKASIEKSKYRSMYIFTGVLFLFFVYSMACWHAIEFGCSFSMRIWTEFIPVIILPLILTWNRYSRITRRIARFSIAIGSIYSFTLTMLWEGCAFFERYDYDGFWNLFT